MFRILLCMLLIIATCFPAMAQDPVEEETVDDPGIKVNRGEVEVLDIVSAYILHGEKVELTLRSDYYASEGSLSLADGSYSLLASGIGGDVTTYVGTGDLDDADLTLTAFNELCFKALTTISAFAFRITCPRYVVRYELRSSSELSLLLVSRLDS